MLPRLLVSLCVLTLFAFPVRADIIETQTFDNLASATAAGWTGFRNAQDGNNFGFRTSNATGGTPAGEAGGTVARTPNLGYYADVTFPGGLSLDNHVQASGEFDITVFAFNNAIRIGHFDATDTTGPFDFLGFQVAEPVPSNTPNIRIIADIFLADGTRVGAALPFTITANGDYTWRYEWEPALNRLVVEFFNSGGSVGTSTLTLSPAERAIGASLNAFGISTGGIGSPLPTNAADVFIDNVAYTVAASEVPEPGSLFVFTILACGAAALRRRS